MGAASEHRGNRLIRRNLETARPQEFELMSELNSLEKYDTASTPFCGPLAITKCHRGWSIEDYEKNRLRHQHRPRRTHQ